MSGIRYCCCLVTNLPGYVMSLLSTVQSACLSHYINRGFQGFCVFAEPVLSFCVLKIWHVGLSQQWSLMPLVMETKMNVCTLAPVSLFPFFSSWRRSSFNFVAWLSDPFVLHLRFRCAHLYLTWLHYVMSHCHVKLFYEGILFLFTHCAFHSLSFRQYARPNQESSTSTSTGKGILLKFQQG